MEAVGLDGEVATMKEQVGDIVIAHGLHIMIIGDGVVGLHGGIINILLLIQDVLKQEHCIAQEPDCEIIYPN